MARIDITLQTELPRDRFRVEAIDKLGSDLGQVGYSLEVQADDVLVWKRRYWPLEARLGLALAIILAIWALAAVAEEGSDATPLILLFVLLGAATTVVRRSDSVQMTIIPADEGCTASLKGTTDGRTARALRELETPR